MNGFALGFLLLNVAGILLLSRRWALLPLLAGACWMTYGQTIDFGAFTFTFIRVFVAAGVVRIILRGERLAGRVNGLDMLALAWAAWALLSSIDHKDPGSALVFRLGMAYDSIGVYFLIRVFCQSLDDVAFLCRIAAIVLVPVAIEMFLEKTTGRNLFSVFGGVSEISVIREGRIRAQGPFMHPILAGTVGAVCLPLMVGLWRQDRWFAQIGLVATLTMVWASGSSGPIMSALAAILGLFMWRKRAHMGLLRWAAFCGYVVLDLVMNAPAYYLLARIDLSGGSTGWHRAALIESGLRHLNEWWLMGTDYTRHWMPTGVSWSPNHTDITNYYLKMGIVGGLPLMLLFIAILAKGFSIVGRVLRQECELSSKELFMIWSMGASLFAQAATCISVSYFDQSFVFLYTVLAAVGSMWGWSVAANAMEGMTPATQPSVDLVPTASSPQALGYPAQSSNGLRLPW